MYEIAHIMTILLSVANDYKQLISKACVGQQ